jgi:hypothetical protein
MNVRELIAKLSELDPELELIVPGECGCEYYSEYAGVYLGYWHSPHGEAEFHIVEQPPDPDDEYEYKPVEGDIPVVSIR